MLGFHNVLLCVAALTVEADCPIRRHWQVGVGHHCTRGDDPAPLKRSPFDRPLRRISYPHRTDEPILGPWHGRDRSHGQTPTGKEKSRLGRQFCNKAATAPKGVFCRYGIYFRRQHVRLRSYCPARCTSSQPGKKRKSGAGTVPLRSGGIHTLERTVPGRIERN